MLFDFGFCIHFNDDFGRSFDIRGRMEFGLDVGASENRDVKRSPAFFRIKEA